MSVVVCSVKVKSLIEISEKAVLIECFDGSKDVVPKSQIYGRDWECETEAYWIAEWILRKKKLQWSSKKKRTATGYVKPSLILTPTSLRKSCPIVITHTPEEVAPVESNELESLRRTK